MKFGMVRSMSRGQFGDIVGTLIQHLPNLSHDEAQQIIGKKGELRKNLQFAINHTLWEDPLAFKLRVIPRVDIAIQDGEYDNIDPRLMDFPVEDVMVHDETVYLFPNYVDALPLDWPERTFTKNGFRAARIEEIAAFGSHYPDFQRKYSIFALGSKKDGISPALYVTNNEMRYFHGLWVDNFNFWKAKSAFLAVKLNQNDNRER